MMTIPSQCPKKGGEEEREVMGGEGVELNYYYIVLSFTRKAKTPKVST